MLSKELIEAYVRPMGFALKIEKHQVEDNLNKYNAVLMGVNAKGAPCGTAIQFNLPCFMEGDDRVLEVMGSTGLRYRVIAHKAFTDITEGLVTSKLAARDWRVVVLDAMTDVISGSILDWFFGNEEPNNAIIDQRISNWFNTDPGILDVDPQNEMETQSAKEAIKLQIYDEMMSHNARIFHKEWLGFIDPCSTPTSEHINCTYRLTQGSTIKDGQIISGGKLHCSTLENNAIGLSLTPRRAYLLRTQFESSEKLLMDEEPLIKPAKNQLSGIHLYTAIMDLGANTFEDCIAISQSAAAKMLAVVQKKETFISGAPMHLQIKEGDSVERKTVVATDEADMSYSFTKLYRPGIVSKIEQKHTLYQGYMAYIIKVIVQCLYPIATGDKISTRAGGKGVVKIIPDNNMPMDQSGKRIEACISPKSIYGRRSILTYWEMMAHKNILDYPDDCSYISGSFNPSPTFEEFVEAGYGDSIQLILNGRDLPEKTFCGVIYYIRIDKHAIEVVSTKGGKTVTNQYGVTRDDARICGQRIDLAKIVALKGREFNEIIKYIINNNSHGISRMKGLFRSLGDKDFIRQIEGTIEVIKNE